VRYDNILNKEKDMNIAIITNGNLFCTITLNKLMKIYSKDIKCIFITKKMPGNKNNFKEIINILKSSGPYYFMFKILYNFIIPPLRKIFRKNTIIQDYSKLYNIPFHFTFNINNAKSVKEIELIKPDLIISVGATQKFEQKILKIPRIMLINVHYSLLPRHKGLSPYFWQLLDDDSEVGITIHKINQELDCGQVLLQKKIKIEKNTSSLGLAINLAHLASGALIESIEQIKLKKVILIPQTLQGGSYHSHPTIREIRKLKHKDRKLFTLKDIKRLLTLEID